MPTNEISPTGRLASLRYGRDGVPAQDVAHGLVGDCVAQVGPRSHNPIVTPARIFAGQTNHHILDVCTDARSTGERRCFELPNFSATSLRYQPRMVSGLARRAICTSPVAPQTLANFRQRRPLAVRQPQIREQTCLQNTVLSRQVLILQREFPIDRSVT